MESYISVATLRNWDRLNVTDAGKKLTKRANKTHSARTILPTEYVTDSNNIPAVEQIIEIVGASDATIPTAMYSLALNLLRQRKLLSGASSNPTNVDAFIKEYEYLGNDANLRQLLLPDNENDILGLVYQSLLLEGTKNQQGLYYTPSSIVDSMLRETVVGDRKTVLDPCCGSGSFLRNTQVIDPMQLFGIDIDPVAVMLCKANLLAKYPGFVFTPQVYCFDYLAEPTLLNTPEHPLLRYKSFDYILSNPPWGAKRVNKKSLDSFACFMTKALAQLSAGGTLNFLLPEAVTNVRAHAWLRERLLSDYTVNKISRYPKVFSGVTTRLVAIEVTKTKSTEEVKFFNGKEFHGAVKPEVLRQTVNCTFAFVHKDEQSILDKLFKKQYSTLTNSVWALGIVTGDNADKLLPTPVDGSEAIFTGKEIQPYLLRPAQKYIIYDRSRFQQVAKDKIYRADEKLVYKFISNRLVFAYDDKRRLFLNSANILIPYLPTLGIKTVLLFLNSELFQFAYMKMFGEVKVLKGNLCALPFPKLAATDETMFADVCDRILDNDKLASSESQQRIYDYYGLSPKQIKHIKEVVHNGALA